MDNPLVVAEAYALEHYPKLAPKGLERAWFVEDHGDVWIVEFSRQGFDGGGIRMMILKRTNKVVHVELTQ